MSGRELQQVKGEWEGAPKPGLGGSSAAEGSLEPRQVLPSQLPSVCKGCRQEDSKNDATFTQRDGAVEVCKTWKTSEQAGFWVTDGQVCRAG